MTKPLKECFIKHLIASGTSSTIFLSNGVKLQGYITWYEDECIALTRDNTTQLIFRHAIATIMPEGALRVHDLEGFDDAGNR